MITGEFGQCMKKIVISLIQNTLNLIIKKKDLNMYNVHESHLQALKAIKSNMEDLIIKADSEQI